MAAGSERHVEDGERPLVVSNQREGARKNRIYSEEKPGVDACGGCGDDDIVFWQFWQFCKVAVAEIQPAA